jgi:hypothetical protein
MAAAWLCLAPAAAIGQGQEPLTESQQTLVAEGWMRPPEPIARAVLAPRHENVSLSSPSPDMRYFLREESEGLPSMASFAREHLNALPRTPTRPSADNRNGLATNASKP